MNVMSSDAIRSERAEVRALMTPAEVAALFHVDAKTVARWSGEGKLKAIRTPGGHRRYLAAEVMALVQQA